MKPVLYSLLEKEINMNKAFIFGGVSSILAALLHIATIIGGPDWYRFLGAGEKFAKLAEEGSWIPGLVTFGVFAVLFTWGLYAFSGAGLIRRLPFLKLALIVIAAIYSARGLMLFPALFVDLDKVSNLTIWSSLISLSIGVSYAVGTKQVWSNISRK